MALAQPRDLEQSLALGRRRHNELCRQKRIFDARSRIIGVRSPGRGGARGAVTREAGGGTAEANRGRGSGDPGAASRAAGAGEDGLVVPTAEGGGRPSQTRYRSLSRAREAPGALQQGGACPPGGSAEARAAPQSPERAGLLALSQIFYVVGGSFQSVRRTNASGLPALWQA